MHHACNPIYRDKNLGGILIIWDRIFGTFAREIEKPEFGIGANRDFGVIENSFGEFKRIWAGARAYPDSFAKLSYLLKRPDSTDSPEQEALREFS